MTRPAINLLGQTFGRLKVLERAPSTGKCREAMWRCACECGTEAVVSGRYLRRGETRSCGCLAREVARANVPETTICKPGVKFGRLTLLEKAGRNDYGAMTWRCRCDCGNTHVAVNKELRRGKTQSCGCIRRGPQAGAEAAATLAYAQEAQSRFKHLQPFVGAVFGRLTVLEHLGMVSKRRMWRCACECGGTQEASSGNLLSGNVKSCGCLKVGRKSKAEKAPKPVKVRAERPAKATRVRASDSRSAQQIGAWPKTAPKVKRIGTADSRPAWRPQSEYKPLSAPAERATGPVTVCPAPKFNHRYGVDPSEVTPLFSAMKPGQYLGGLAA
jgi:hypothetical protein